MLRKIIIFFLTMILIIGSAILGAASYVYYYKQPQSLESAQVAIVFGASVLPGGRPSIYLEARTRAAVELYHAELVSYIATTGGITADYPSEGEVAAQLAIELGVPAERIIIEGTSTSTVANLANLLPSLQEYNIDDVILVSDSFHLGRARRIALDLGIEKVQVHASQNQRPANEERFYIIREIAALLSYLYLGPNWHQSDFLY